MQQTQIAPGTLIVINTRHELTEFQKEQAYALFGEKEISLQPELSMQEIIDIGVTQDVIITLPMDQCLEVLGTVGQISWWKPINRIRGEEGREFQLCHAFTYNDGGRIKITEVVKTPYGFADISPKVIGLTDEQKELAKEFFYGYQNMTDIEFQVFSQQFTKKDLENKMEQIFKHLHESNQMEWIP